MTHDQTMRANPTLEPSSVLDATTGKCVPCDGHLKLVDSWPDRRVTIHGPVDHVASMYRCERCNRRIVLERAALGDDAVAIAYAVLNDYLPVGPRQMVQNLAGRMDLPK